MTDDKKPKPDERLEEQSEPPATPDPPPRSAPTRRDDSEKALGLEMARLFGLSPKLMVAPKPRPAQEDRPEAARDDEDGQPHA
jgi:hypothetical protein